MALYRYVSMSVSQVGEREFNAFGQAAEFPEELAEHHQRGGAAFIPEEEFQSLELDQMEVLRYTSPNFFGMIPDSFMEKVAEAQETYRRIRASLEAA